MFVPEYSFTVTEHDPDKPWIVLGSERRTIELDDAVIFFDWAQAQWPEPHWKVELDPLAARASLATRGLTR